MASVMNRFLGVVILGLAFTLATVPLSRAAEEKGAPLDIQAESVEYNTKTGVATASGTPGKQVRIEYRGMVLEADEVLLNEKTKDVAA
ncbi:MAG: hypothetical protein HN904_08245, partial [Victivallales bacterium]|nr:hypothetical protein [Victivallales bacterium]